MNRLNSQKPTFISSYPIASVILMIIVLSLGLGFFMYMASHIVACEFTEKNYHSENYESPEQERVACLEASSLFKLSVIFTIAAIAIFTTIISPYLTYRILTSNWKVGEKQNWLCLDCRRNIANEVNFTCDGKVLTCITCGKRRWPNG